ncbi:hypothetical protein, partial [uncultured Megasphaera sp.]|uniref:hypothetical protein n=1 Tax=uncultured Megasphaera sp. TaxID=165188 RepID=UPI0025D6200D
MIWLMAFGRDFSGFSASPAVMPMSSTPPRLPKNCLFYEADGDIFKSLPARKESGKIVLHLKRSAALHRIDELD